MSGGSEYHAPNPDAKLKAKKFWCVAGKKKGDDGKWFKVAGTFDNKDMALSAAQRAKDALLIVEVLECGPVEWREFVPETKGDREKWSKIDG